MSKNHPKESFCWASFGGWLKWNERARHCQKQKPNEPNQTICTVWPWKLTGTRLYLRWMRLSFCHSAETNDWFIEDVTITIAFNIELPKRRLGWRLDPGITRVLIFFFFCCYCCVFDSVFFPTRLFFIFTGSTWSQLWHSFCIAVHVMTQSTIWVFVLFFSPVLTINYFSDVYFWCFPLPFLFALLLEDMHELFTSFKCID